MDELIKLRAAKTILQRGVKVMRLKTPLALMIRGMPLNYTLTIHQPTIKELVEISELIVKMRVTSEELISINLADSYQLVNGNATMAVEALVIASRLKHPLIERELFVKWLTQTMDAPTFRKAWKLLVLHGGVADFIITTRLILQWDGLNPQA